MKYTYKKPVTDIVSIQLFGSVLGTGDVGESGGGNGGDSWANVGQLEEDQSLSTDINQPRSLWED